jgi:hypothetical protein
MVLFWFKNISFIAGSNNQALAAVVTAEMIMKNRQIKIRFKYFFI